MKKEELEMKNLEKKDITIPIEKACKRGFLTILPIFILLIAGYYLINGWYDWSIQPWRDYFTIVGIFIVGFVIHEFIHAVGWAYNSEGKWKSIRFGYDYNYLKTYCDCTEAIKVGTYKLFKILPLFITGIVPYLIGIITGNFHLSIAGSCLVAMCGVDLILVIMFRKVSNNSYIICNDNPSIYGGEIYSEK